MRVVTTGASRGIGQATAVKLVADGAKALTLCDVAYLDELETLAEELRGSGAKVRTLKADMARPAAPAQVIAAAVKAMGGIDAIVGNAGITAPHDIAETIAFLLGPQASYVTGQALVVDGGLTRAILRNVPGVAATPAGKPKGRSAAKAKGKR